MHVAETLKRQKDIVPPDGQETALVPAAKSGASTGKTTGHRKRGRRKVHPKYKADWMPNAFGKYPTSSSIKKYIEATRHAYAPSTQREIKRKLRYILTELRDLGAPRTPQKFKECHIRVFLDWMDRKGLDNETKRKYLKLLKDYLAFYDNDIIGRMLAKKYIKIPKAPPKEITALSLELVHAIHKSTEMIDGWEGSVARFITMAYPYTGLRPSELRTMKYEDISPVTWILRVSHPKGEDTYGIKRKVGILPQLRPAFLVYLKEREDFLKSKGIPVNSEPLIPNRRGTGYWSAALFRKLKGDIQRISGIKFKLKDYRSTFCQLAIDLGADISAVSKVMGHNSTLTTEKHYGRIRDDPAISEIERAFSKPTPDLKKCSIKNEPV